MSSIGRKIKQICGKKISTFSIFQQKHLQDLTLQKYTNKMKTNIWYVLFFFFFSSSIIEIIQQILHFQINPQEFIIILQKMPSLPEISPSVACRIYNFLPIFCGVVNYLRPGLLVARRRGS